MDDACSRCGRPAPPFDSEEFGDWSTDGETIVCPDCRLHLVV